MSELEQQEGFLGRWSRRKAETLHEQAMEVETDAPEEQALQVSEEQAVEEIAPPPSDEDMPPLETLNEDSDYSGFLSPNVSEELRKRALRKLFSSTVFNQVDGLDDYDEDFTSFEPLGDLITSDMKHRMEMEAKRKMEEITDDEAVEELEDDELTTEELEALDEQADSSNEEPITEIETETSDEPELDLGEDVIHPEEKH